MEWISISRAELSKCLDIKMGKKGWKKKKGNKNKFPFGLLLDVRGGRNTMLNIKDKKPITSRIITINRIFFASFNYSLCLWRM